MLSPDVQAFISGSDVDTEGQGAKLTSPYQQSAWIYIAVSVLAENVAQIPFRISRVGKEAARQIRSAMRTSNPAKRDVCRRALWENIVESGDVVDLFENPHPSMNKTLFWEQVVSWDALRGEFFILPLDDEDQPVDLSARKPRISRMLTLTPDLFWHMVVGYSLEGWRYTGSPLLTPIESQMLVPSEVIHSRSFNPYNYWRGMSPVLVALLPASADYAAAMFQKGLLLNNADTGVIATTEQSLTQEQREQFMTALRERKRKAGTPDRPLFLSSGVKIEKPTISNVDMQFLETRKLLRQEIGAIFKVPDSLMGFSENKSGLGGAGVLDGEKHSFVEQTLAVRCHRAESAVAPIVRSFGEDLVGWFDIEGLPVMQEARRGRLDSATKAFAIGVPFNEITRVYDLGFPSLPWGNKGYLPFNLQDAAAVEEPMPGEGETPNSKPQTPNDEPKRPDQGDQQNPKPDEPPTAGMRRLLGEIAAGEPERRTPNASRGSSSKQIWERHMRQRRATVKLFESKTTRVLNEFRAKTLSRLAATHLGKGSDGVPECRSAAGEVKSLIDLVFNAPEFGNELMAVLTPVINGALQEASDLVRSSELGMDDPWKFPPQKALEFITGRRQSIQGCGDTVRSQLNTSLEEGFTNGESLDKLSDRVRGVFNNLTKYEAKRIASTESAISFNFARDAAMEHAGTPYKAWLSSHGPHVREGHAEAEVEYLDAPIPFDEPFEVMNEEGEVEQMMYPGDDSLGATAGNIINCQCIQLAARKTGEDEKRWRFFILGIGEVWFPKREAGEAIRIKHVCLN